MAGVKQASYSVEFDWDQDGTFSNSYASMFSHGLRVDSINTVRGKSDDLAEMQAGTGALTIIDAAGILNTKRAASPLYGKVIPNTPCRISMTYASMVYPLYYGFIRTAEYDPGVRFGQAKFELNDLFMQLTNPRTDGIGGGATYPVIARVDNPTTGAAINAILDAINWSPTMRSIDTGDTLPWFEAIGSSGALAQDPLGLITDLVQANAGLFYIDVRGYAVFEDRNTRWARAAYASIDATMQAINPGASIDNVTNIWNATRLYETVTGDQTTLTPDTEQSKEDSTSVGLYGKRTQSITSKYWPDNGTALNAAAYRVIRTKNADSPLWSFDVDNRADDQMLALAQAELLRRLTVNDPRTGTAGDYWVEQITHDISATTRSHKCSLLLTERDPAATPFVIGVNAIGDPNPIGW